MHGDVALDGGDQVRYAAEDTAFQAVGRDAAKEALDHVEPRCGSRREMDMETWMFLQLLLDLEIFVRRIVVADQMQRLFLGRFPIDLAQEV